MATQSTGHFFDAYAQNWDATYLQPAKGRAYEFIRRHQLALEILRERAPKNAHILEIGCGAGHAALELGKQGHLLTCVDVSAQMLETTRRNFARAALQCNTLQGNIDELNLSPNSFDIVYALGVTEYMPDVAHTLRSIARLLKPGGFCLISFSNKSSIFRRIEHPLKRLGAAVAYLLTRKSRYKDIALKSGHAHNSKAAINAMTFAGLHVAQQEFYSYGFCIAGHWLPSLAQVTKWEREFSRSRLKETGRGFILVSRKSSEAIGICQGTMQHLASLAQVHAETFAGTMGASLGASYRRRFLSYFLRKPNTVVEIAMQENRVVGYVVGAPVGYDRSMTRYAGIYAAIGLILHPTLIRKMNFRRELLRRCRSILNTPSPVKSDACYAAFSLVAIGVAASAQGNGVGQQLMAAFEKRAHSQGHSLLRLSVYKTNQSARALYERMGWQAQTHPTNPELLYYTKTLEAVPR